MHEITRDYSLFSGYCYIRDEISAYNDAILSAYNDAISSAYNDAISSAYNEEILKDNEIELRDYVVKNNHLIYQTITNIVDQIINSLSPFRKEKETFNDPWRFFGKERWMFREPTEKEKELFEREKKLSEIMKSLMKDFPHIYSLLEMGQIIDILKGMLEYGESYRNERSIIIEDKKRHIDKIEQECYGLRSEIGELNQQLKSEAEERADSLLAVRDQYFITANKVHEIGESVGVRFRELETFFQDEAIKVEKELLLKGKAKLLERDQAMVENTAQFMKDTGKTSVVLLVGSAHIEGIADQLKAREISFIGGKLTACDDKIEPWEEDSLSDRWHPQHPVFLPDENSRELLPTTRFQDRNWIDEQSAKLQLFNRLHLEDSEKSVGGLAGNSKIFNMSEMLDVEKESFKDRAILIGSFLLTVMLRQASIL
jgi:hypothetical protein